MVLENLISFYEPQLTLGIVAEVLLIVGVGIILAMFPYSYFSLMFEMLYETMYDMFAGILSDKEKPWVKTFVVSLFFVILISNLFGLLLDFIAPMTGTDVMGEFQLHHYIHHITADLNFNLALAWLSVVIVLGIQFSHLGLWQTLYTYFPIFGKNIFVIQKESISPKLYIPVYIFTKACDITISLFLGALEIIGLLAKVFSLSFRLFGNMASGTILLGMIFAFMNYTSTFMGGLNFPIGLPLIVYAQGLLVAFVQAFVFALLICVFVVVGREEGHTSP
jgi:F0F1-type ATP synthase membrane subunit a